MRNQEWDATLAQLHSLDLAKLVLCLFASDAVDGEATLGIVDEAEVLASLLDGDDVHKAGWVGWVGAYLAIDLDQALHDNGLGLAAIEGVLQAVERIKVSTLSAFPSYMVNSEAHRLRMKTINGMQSRSLCGPGEAFGA